MIVRSNSFISSRLRRQNRRAGRQKKIAEINVIPFVDVTLVLLIVFMVAAPLLTVGVPVKLPATAAKPILSVQEAPLEVTLTAEGKLFLMNEEINYNKLISSLDDITSKKGSSRNIFLKIDNTVRYEKVAKILGALNYGGYVKITFITDMNGPLLAD
ncbi:MAG: biopolymer transporter ExbD [Paracoccaceae bacterium]